MNSNDLGVLSARVMERVEELFGDDAEIRTCAIVVEVDQPRCTHIAVECSDDRPWFQLAFLDKALSVVESQQFEAERADQDD